MLQTRLLRERPTMLIRMCSECERSTVLTGRKLCRDCAERLDADLAVLLLVPRQACPEGSTTCTCAPRP